MNKSYRFIDTRVMDPAVRRRAINEEGECKIEQGKKDAGVHWYMAEDPTRGEEDRQGKPNVSSTLIPFFTDLCVRISGYSRHWKFVDPISFLPLLVLITPFARHAMQWNITCWMILLNPCSPAGQVSSEHPDPVILSLGCERRPLAEFSVDYMLTYIQGWALFHGSRV